MIVGNRDGLGKAKVLWEGYGMLVESSSLPNTKKQSYGGRYVWFHIVLVKSEFVDFFMDHGDLAARISTKISD